MIEFLTSLGLLGWIVVLVPILAFVFRKRLWLGEGASTLPADETLPIGEPPDFRGPPPS